MKEFSRVEAELVSARGVCVFCVPSALELLSSAWVLDMGALVWCP